MIEIGGPATSDPIQVQLKQTMWWVRAQLIGYIAMIIVYVGQYYAIWYEAKEAKKYVDEKVLVHLEELSGEYGYLREFIETQIALTRKETSEAVSKDYKSAKEKAKDVTGDLLKRFKKE